MTKKLSPETMERVRALLARFRLPTLAAELVRRMVEAGHEDALPTLLEALEAEQDERGQRRCLRLLRNSRPSRLLLWPHALQNRWPHEVANWHPGTRPMTQGDGCPSLAIG